MPPKPRKAAKRPAAPDETGPSTSGTSQGEVVEVLPAPVSDEVIADTVREIQNIQGQADLAVSLRVGQLLIDRFFAGDVANWRARGETDASLRKLARHPELARKVSTIYRALAVYELCQRLPNVSELKNLAVGHYRAVLGLPEKQQQKLLTTASQKEWEVAKLREEATGIRKKEGDKRGRKADHRFVKGIRRMGKLLDEEDNWFDDLDKVDDLDEKEAEVLWKTVTGMKLKCEELQKRLQVRVPGFMPRTEERPG